MGLGQYEYNKKAYLKSNYMSINFHGNCQASNYMDKPFERALVNRVALLSSHKFRYFLAIVIMPVIIELMKIVTFRVSKAPL